MNKKEAKNGAPFYIALCCCVAVIGLVGYAGRLAANHEEATVPISDASALIAPETTPISPAPTEKAMPTPVPLATAKPQSVPTAGKAVDTPAPTPDPVEMTVFSQPCTGKVIKEMSRDELEYNNMLGDWRTHNGVDIALDEGEEVKAIHSGTVTEMYEGVLGETVIIDCLNGYTALYACLSGTDRISIGQEISAGDTLGTAGAVGSENTTEPHLHLELIKDGVPVDPCKYITFSE